jgi:predicted AAA+ superfamily ATPase
MGTLFELYFKLLRTVDLRFQRGLMENIDWGQRLIGITGARGVGKTTLLLQYLKKRHKGSDRAFLYVSMDHIWFAKNSLLELADQFAKTGGRVLILDEVHKYANWSREIKNIYDFYPELQIIFTGSSLLEILNAAADLSRRAVLYRLRGLSFREFLSFDQGYVYPSVSFEQIVQHHIELAQEISSDLRPLQYWKTYLEAGYYPFYKTSGELYHQQLQSVVNLILEIELPLLRKVEIGYISKIKQLLAIVADEVPFTPNISKLSEKIGINRTTLLSYLYFLQESELLHGLYQDNEGISLLQKPQKIYLQNTNLSFALGNHANIGNIRETFFLNQVSAGHRVSLPSQFDFKVDNNWLVEVGGKNKKNIPTCDVVAVDDIEVGFDKKIPLWLFGFLY